MKPVTLILVLHFWGVGWPFLTFLFGLRCQPNPSSHVKTATHPIPSPLPSDHNPGRVCLTLDVQYLSGIVTLLRWEQIDVSMACWSSLNWLLSN